MNTTFYFTVSALRSRMTCAEQILREAHADTEKLENELSEFRDSTPVWALNHSKPGEKIAASQSLLQLLEESKLVYEWTDGAFSYLAKGTERNVQSLQWDESHVWRESEHTFLSFGAIGKGFALDRARTLLEQEGFSDYILSAGGSSILISGYENAKLPWTWGWSWKKAEGGPVGIALSHPSGKTVAIGVSGLHEKGSHILDPRSGAPCPERQQSFLVGFTSAVRADALSTAFFVLGWDDAMEVARRIGDVPAMAAAQKGDKIIWNGKFESLWGNLSHEKTTFSARRPTLP